MSSDQTKEADERAKMSADDEEERRMKQQQHDEKRDVDRRSQKR